MVEQLRIFIEEDDGRDYLRIQESRLDRDYDTVISDYYRDDKPGDTSYYSRVSAGDSVLYENFDISNTKVGIGIYGEGDVDIYNYEFVDNNSIRTKEDGTLSDNKFSSAVRLTAGSQIFDIDAPITIQRVYADGGNNPMKVDGLDYSSTNKDFITNDNRATEGDAAEIYIRDFTAKNMSDAIFDNKGTIYIMNGTLSNAHRILRAWPESEIIIVNSVIELGDGQDLMWFKDTTASIKYFNVLWNGEPHPDPDLIGIESRPDGMSREEFIAQTLVELDHNVLEDISPFFATYNADYSAEVSVNGDAWQSVTLDPALFTEHGIIGDPKIELPDLGNGDYRVRVTGTLSDGTEINDETTYTITDAGYDYGAPDVPVDKPAEPEPETEPEPEPEPAPKPEPEDAVGSTTSGDDVITGTNADDRLRGSGGDDTIDSKDGNDEISGGDDNDTLSGGLGNDVIKGDSGDDILYGGEGDDDLRGSTGRDSLFGDAGNDSLRGGSGIDNLDGGAGSDQLSGGAGDDTLDGGSGADVLLGDDGSDTLNGGDGDDVLSGGKDADLLIGGHGADIYVFDDVYRSNHDTILGFSSLEQDRIDVSMILVGHSVTRTNFDKFVRVDETDDSRFSISINDDGAGKEFTSIAEVELDDTSSTLITDSLSDWYEFLITGSDYIAPTPAIEESIEEPASVTETVIDPIDEPEAEPEPEPQPQPEPEPESEPDPSNELQVGSVVTAPIALEISGTSGNDHIKGLGGDDNLRGSGGDDTLDGMAGDDDINGGSGDDILFGGAGDDKLVGARGDDTANGGAGDDYLLGESGNDRLEGGAGNDDLRGADHNDELFGDAGNDALRGGSGDDRLDGGADNDMLDGGSGSDFLLGGAGIDQLFGRNGLDVIYGGAGGDALFGGGDADTLKGGDGDDILNGGSDADVLSGGAGADTFVFDGAYRSNFDLITDFSISEGDRIDVSKILESSPSNRDSFGQFVRVSETDDGQFNVAINDDGKGREFIAIARVDVVDGENIGLGETSADWFDLFDM